MCLYTNKRYNKAKTPFIKVIKIRKKVLKQEHLFTLTSIANLALIYRD
jgi:hypothetical protein